jgi:hypothetical protein
MRPRSGHFGDTALALRLLSLGAGQRLKAGNTGWQDGAGADQFA